MAAVDEYIKATFEEAECMEVFNERANYRIPLRSLQKLSVAFESLEAGMDSLNTVLCVCVCVSQ